jgi:Domain of unknown function (DUF4287)
MPTQKLFKRRVRTRMAKTGESYTTARLQLLRKAEADADAPEGPAIVTDSAAPELETVPREAMGVPDEAMLAKTGRTHAGWFALLDAWGATGHNHTEIASWLKADHGVPGWWSQSISVAYERARGMRARHEMAGGFEVTVNRTIAVPSATVLAAFTDEAIRERWLPGAGMRQRRTTAAASARFDWREPASRVVVFANAKGTDRTTVTVVHEKLPDAEAAVEQKAAWRDRLATLKNDLEGAR